MTAVSADIGVVAANHGVAFGSEGFYALDDKSAECLGVSEHNHMPPLWGQPPTDEQAIARPQRRLHAGVPNVEPPHWQELRHVPGVD